MIYNQSSQPQSNKILSARLHAEEVAQILGFADHDIPVLVSAKLLRPLAKPEQSCTNYFALCEIQELAHNVSWLNKATQALYDYWRNRNQRKKRTPKKETAPNSDSGEISLSE